MLNQRVTTGLIIAAIGLAILFTVPPWGFALFAGLVLLAMGGREGARIAGVHAPGGQLANAGLLVAAGLAAWAWLMPDYLVQILLPACVLWLGPFAWLAVSDRGTSMAGAWRLVKLGLILVILLAAWFAASWLQLVNPWLVFVLVVIVATGDIGAYFFGRAIGGPKLAPRISPGKTWAGVLGACLVAPACTALAAWLIPDLPFAPLLWAVLALVLTPIGIGGDLFFSLLKRHAGKKDTGTLLPGHGGVLDRLDSICAVLPFYALVVWGVTP